ncbi:caspase family protein [Bacteroides sp. 519]|uniref:caspase family protein n=1 Tax=Bacteroides sp. 519 TaxID=2302937 RepID=UPI0013D2A797|nr:caspase family protein [Bacteroides sp. 519]NDV59473.1 caspase [Bacteroides sp. 519]
MRRVLMLAIIGVITAVCIQAQDAAGSFSRANQQFVMFESEHDKGTNITNMYNHLLESHIAFIKVLDAADNEQYIDATKNRLRSMYPFLLNAAVYYSEQKDQKRALDFASAYIEMPYLSVFRDELLSKDKRYISVLYYAAVAAYNLEKNNQALKYFQEYLNTETETQMKDCFVYMNMIYQSQKNYTEQERVLEQAITKYPVSLDFYYNLVNVYIATNNLPALNKTIDRILEVDPNNDKVLPIKARLLEKEKKYKESLEMYERLHALYPANFEIKTGLARANFNYATEIINSGAREVNDTQYAIIRQRAAEYLENAHKLFLEILEKEPFSTQYMKGLVSVYQYMDEKPEYDVLSKIIEDGVSYNEFAPRLAAYKKELAESAVTPAEQEPIPVPVNPAKLVITIDEFADANENKVIDAGESFFITFTIENKGEGDAYDLRLRLSEQSGYDKYFDGPREIDGGNILAGSSKQYTFRYIAKKELPTVETKINIYAFEANGFDADPSELIVYAQEYDMPQLRVADYQFFAPDGSSIKLGSSGKLTLAVQNLGTQAARNVRINFALPRNVYNTDSQEMTIDSIPSGEVATIDYSFLVNKRFDQDSIVVLVNISEETRSSHVNEAFRVKMGEYLTASSSITIGGAGNIRKVNAEDVTLGFKSELLENVPEGAENKHRYALIIGNEDYSSTGANAEINVPYAINDASVFREYCIRTFGIPVTQIKMIPNATAGMMHEQLDWLVNIAGTDPEAELFFYYSGHGNNEESTKEPYLLPVDITGKNIRLGLSLNELYTQLAKFPVKASYVFLDACFSGGYKSAEPLIAQKGIRVVPKSGVPQGNTLAFSSSSGDQTSSVFHEKKHGYYTYYLIKTIKEANGDINLKDIFTKTCDEVKKATARLGKIQEPQCLVSPTWDTWGEIILKTPEQAPTE